MCAVNPVPKENKEEERRKKKAEIFSNSEFNFVCIEGYRLGGRKSWVFYFYVKQMKES